jgi:hypothetical protein
LTDLLFHGSRPEVPELILILRNERPIPTADFGKLFSALAADYRRLNRGRTLVIAGLETGSIIAHLQEAYATFGPYAQTIWELANTAKHLKEFVEILRDLLGKAKDDPQNVGLFQRKKSPPGIESLEALAKITINGGGEAELRYSGEEIIARLTSSEALKIREQTKLSTREPSPPLGQRQMESDMFVGETHFDDAGRIADRVVAAGPEAEAIIRAVASALQESGLGHVLETVAEKLDERGHPSLAVAVRASLHQDNRESEPPELA